MSTPAALALVSVRIGWVSQRRSTYRDSRNDHCGREHEQCSEYDGNVDSVPDDCGGQAGEHDGRTTLPTTISRR
jgi:hypothetical protein